MNTATRVDTSIRRLSVRGRWTLRFAIVGVLALAFWLASHRGEPERMYEINNQTGLFPVFDVPINGKVYNHVVNGSEVDFYGTPLSTGVSKIIGRDSLGTMSLGRVTVTEWGIFYSLQPKRAGAIGGGGVSGGNGGMPKYEYLGTFMHSASRKPLPGEKRSFYKWPVRSKAPNPELRVMPLSGGGPRTVKVDTLGIPLENVSPVYAKDGIYWVHALQARTFRVTAPLDSRTLGAWDENVAVNDLMFSRYNGSPAERIVSNVCTSYVGKTKSFITWTTPRVFPDKRIDWHCLRLPDRSLSSINGLESEWNFGGMGIREYGERLYWTVGNSSAGNAGKLLSVMPDGTDRRVELDAAAIGKRILVLNSIMEYHGYLYFFIGSEKAQQSVHDTDGGVYGPGPPSYRTHLVKFKPGNPGRIVAELDADNVEGLSNCRLDDGYLYFSRNVGGASWFDWMSTVSTAKTTTCMFRIPLPK